MRLVLSLSTLLALSAFVVGCGPRTHLAPDMGQSTKALFAVQAKAGADPEAQLPSLGADVGRMVHQKLVQSFSVKGSTAGAAGDGGASLLGGMTLPGMGGAGAEGKGITLSGE